MKTLTHYVLRIGDNHIVNLRTGNIKYFKSMENAQKFINKHRHKWKEELLTGGITISGYTKEKYQEENKIAKGVGDQWLEQSRN